MKKLVIGAVVLVVIIAAIVGGGHSKSKGAAKKSGQARFSIALNQSSCWEDLSAAYVRCDIRVRNRGTASGGLPDVNVLVRYSDGSDTIFTNTTDALNDRSSPDGEQVPAHGVDDVYFAHSYNEQGHALLKAAVSLDLNAKSYPYITVKSPQG
jgi:hypothetical protein